MSKTGKDTAKVTTAIN